MAPALIVTSFILFVFLAVFLPVKRVYGDIPSLSVVVWLILANLLQGVNTSLFHGTVSVKAFAWCDICAYLSYLCLTMKTHSAAHSLEVGAGHICGNPCSVSVHGAQPRDGRFATQDAHKSDRQAKHEDIRGHDVLDRAWGLHVPAYVLSSFHSCIT